MFKEFNKKFYRSLYFYLALLFLLSTIGQYRRNDISVWFFLPILLLPFSIYRSLWTTESNMKENWKVWLGLVLICLGFWLEFFSH